MYDNDQQQQADPHTRVGEYVIIHGSLGWCVYTGPNLDLVGFGYRSAADAVASLPEDVQR